MSNYIYHGDKFTAPELKKKPCTAVRRSDGKCIRGRNGSMLVAFPDGTRHIIIGRLLRKVKPIELMVHLIQEMDLAIYKRNQKLKIK